MPSGGCWGSREETTLASRRLLGGMGKEDLVSSVLGAELLGPADGLEPIGERKRNQEEHLGFWLKLVSRSYH